MKTPTAEEIAFIQKLMYQKVCERVTSQWYMFTQDDGKHHLGYTICMKCIEDSEPFCAEHLHTPDAKAGIPEVLTPTISMPCFDLRPKHPGRKTGKAKRCRPSP